jgi:hypothetical protein
MQTPHTATNPSPDKRTSLSEALLALQRIESLGSGRDWRLAVRISNPGGFTSNQTVEVDGLHAGFDWEAGQVIIEPARPLTILTQEQLADITKSVRAGGSWHAFQREKKNMERIAALEAEVARLRERAPNAE